MWSLTGCELVISSQASGNLSQGWSSEFRVRQFRVQQFRVFQRTLVQFPSQAAHRHPSPPLLDGSMSLASSSTRTCVYILPPYTFFLGGGWGGGEPVPVSVSLVSCAHVAVPSVPRIGL